MFKITFKIKAPLIAASMLDWYALSCFEFPPNSRTSFSLCWSGFRCLSIFLHHNCNLIRVVLIYSSLFVIIIICFGCFRFYYFFIKWSFSVSFGMSDAQRRMPIKRIDFVACQLWPLFYGRTMDIFSVAQLWFFFVRRWIRKWERKLWIAVLWGFLTFFIFHFGMSATGVTKQETFTKWLNAKMS